MRRIGTRIAALAFAAALAGSSAVDALNLHPCPHHGAGALAGTSSYRSGPDAHAQHRPGGGADHDDRGGPCTCVGTCSVDVSSPLAALSSATRSVWYGPLDRATPAPARTPSLPGPPPFLLPYAHAPPPALPA